MEVLQNYKQVVDARKKLKEKNISFIDSSFIIRLRNLLRKLGLKNQISIGDIAKSWDILSFIQFIEKKVPKNEPILDIGCYCSEFVVALDALGYKKLSAVDLNPGISYMPAQNRINYEVSDFMSYKPKVKNFRVISAISVLEHGFDRKRFLKSMSRILMPNGYLFISFDYWDKKIDTSKTRLFDMEWTIFSSNEVRELIEEAKEFNLFPINEPSFKCDEKAITHAGYKYTFGQIIFKKIT
jgi:SAM-dependent methyltransferase